MTMTSNEQPDEQPAMGHMQPVGVALVGYGWWGKVIGAQLAASRHFHLVSVVEVDPQIRRTLTEDAARFGFGVALQLSEVLVDPAVEAVVLCTPHPQHAEQIVATARAGRHVFCEKPLCLTLADAERALAECESRGLVVGIGHERRFEPAIIDMRRDIAAGKLGTLLQIEGNFSQDKFFALPKDNWRLSDRYAPVGPLSATGIHIVDLAIALLGPAEAVWARLATRGSEFENGDTLGLLLAFPGGANALVSAILATSFEGRFAVYGSKGWIEVRDRTHPEHPTGWDVTTAMRDGERHTRFYPPASTVLANLTAFAEAVRGRSPYPVSAREMRANVAALEAIVESVRSHGVQTIARVD